MLGGRYFSNNSRKNLSAFLHRGEAQLCNSLSTDWFPLWAFYTTTQTNTSTDLNGRDSTRLLFSISKVHEVILPPPFFIFYICLIRMTEWLMAFLLPLAQHQRLVHFLHQRYFKNEYEKDLIPQYWYILSIYVLIKNT